MRILIITATYPPTINGVSVSANNLYVELKKRGHEVLVMAPKNGTLKDKKDIYRYPSSKNPLYPQYPIPLLIYNDMIFDKIKAFKPNIIHVHHPGHIGYFAKIISERLSIPLIFTYHTRYGDYAKKYFRFLTKDLKKILIESPISGLCNYSTCVLVPSKSMVSTVKKLGVNSEIQYIPTIPNDLDHNLPSKNKCRKIISLSKSKNILLYVGRLSNEKEVNILIDSMKYLNKRFRLIICGDGPSKNDLINLTNKLGLEKSVSFVGNIDRTLLPYYYKSADVFYFSSRTETQGVILWEAISYGLPIVAVDSDVTREWVKTDFGRLVEANSKDLAKAIISIFTNNINHLSKNAVLFSKGFSSDLNIRKIIKIYKKSIKKYKFYNSILSTGWQSWSVSGKNTFLRRDYNPLNSEFIPKISGKVELKEPVKGWSSWYAFGRNINDKKILDQTKIIISKNISVDYIQIDEGYTKWGEWDKTFINKFPEGLLKLSNDIHKHGKKSGIWMAPFLVDPDSEIVKKHKDWIVAKKGRFINGINWTFLDNLYFKRYLLDIRKKEVKSFIFNSIDFMLNNCKFDLLKLDFLYSVYFISGITAKQAGGFIREMFKYIKLKYPHVYTVACGAPLLPVVGVADSVRIGPDTISPFLDGIPLLARIFHKYRLNQVLNNIEKRNHLRKYFNLDPDVFVCRKSLGLNEEETLNLKGKIKELNGNIFLGDDLTKLTDNDIKKYIHPLLS